MNIESQGMNKQDQCYPGNSLVLEEIWGEDNSPRRFGMAKHIKKETQWHLKTPLGSTTIH